MNSTEFVNLLKKNKSALFDLIDDFVEHGHEPEEVEDSNHFKKLIELNREFLCELVNDYNNPQPEEVEDSTEDASAYMDSLEDRNGRLEAEVRRLEEVTADQSKAFNISIGKLEAERDAKSQAAYCWSQRVQERLTEIQAKDDKINTLAGENLDLANMVKELSKVSTGRYHRIAQMQREVTALRSNNDRQAATIRGRVHGVLDGLKIARKIVKGHDHEMVIIRRAITAKIKELEGK